MKDIPVFTTEFGIAGLILREIPYTGSAYVRIHSAIDTEGLLAECRQFCCMAGAQRIFAAGDGIPETYPLHTSVIAMRCDRTMLGESDAALFPVTEQTVDTFRRIYNEKASKVDNAAWMDDADCRQMLQRGDGYFVHKDSILLGIGRVYDGQLLWVASVQPGAGGDAVKALCSALSSDSVTLDVASTNHKAIRLYESLGFIPVLEKSRWYKIF